jgi:hypothetical protein
VPWLVLERREHEAQFLQALLFRGLTRIITPTDCKACRVAFHAPRLRMDERLHRLFFCCPLSRHILSPSCSWPDLAAARNDTPEAGPDLRLLWRREHLPRETRMGRRHHLRSWQPSSTPSDARCQWRRDQPTTENGAPILRLRTGRRSGLRERRKISVVNHPMRRFAARDETQPSLITSMGRMRRHCAGRRNAALTRHPVDLAFTLAVCPGGPYVPPRGIAGTSSSTSPATSQHDGVRIFPDTPDRYAARVAYYELRRLNSLPNS